MRIMDPFETVKASDFVEYYVFLIDQKSANNSNLQKIHESLISFVAPLAESYMWHRDEFSIAKVIPEKSGKEVPHLHGTVHYGDNIEDEWFVVFLLMSFSKQCSDVFIKVIDSDGEFFLVEAATSLPEWLQSESCNYRSYIYDGTIKLVPGTFSKEFDFISKVAKFIKEGFGATEVEKNITHAVEKKVNPYANGLKEFLHQSRAYIPVQVAALLDAKPSLIASAITAYCERDPIDKKICCKMRHFPPERMVLRLITFTKFLYAMICHEKLEMDRNRLAWSLPASSHLNYKEHVLGLKITCGFEILAAKCKNSSKSDLSLNKKWLQYLAVLKRKGYFKDFLEGSKEYVNLEKQARNYFLENTDATKTDSNCVLNTLQTVNFDYDTMKRDESELQPSNDEEWMKVDEENFNNLLRERFDCPDLRTTDSPEVISAALNTFFNRLSDLEGVETGEHHLADLSHMDIDADHPVKAISFDADCFLPSLEKMLDKLVVADNEGIFDEISSADSNSGSENDTDNDEENASEDADIKSYMQLMDQELKNTSLSESLSSNFQDASASGIPKIDKNIVTNICKSYEEQYGGSGPAGNLLHSMGLRLNIQKEN